MKIEFSQEKRFRLPWQERYEPLSAPEAEDRLETGRVRVRLPDADLPLPCTTREDLQEARVFAGELPPEQLAQPDLGTALNDLSSEGWQFRAEPGQVGRYGAYNGLTDPARRLDSLQACKGDLRVPLQSETPARLRDFLRDSPLAALEAGGYTFQDPKGRPAPAFLTQLEGSVGRQGEPWLPVDQATEPNLQTFAAYRAEGDLAQARRAWELTHRPQLPSLGELAAELPWRLARQAGAGAAPLTLEELQGLARREKGLELAGEAARVPELTDSVAAGRLWQKDLPPEQQETAWHTLLQAVPIQDEATRLQAFQAVLQALPAQHRPSVLAQELTRPGADALLVGKYARQAGSDLLPVFARLGLQQPARWCAAVQSDKSRQSLQKFFLEHPTDAEPPAKLSELWGAMRYDTSIPNDERARLVRSELSHCTRIEDRKQLTAWIRELDPAHASTDLRGLMGPVASGLAADWCRAISDGPAQSALCQHLLEQDPQHDDGPTRVRLLEGLWSKLPSSADNAQRGRLLEANLRQTSDPPSRLKMLQWGMELGLPDAVEEARAALGSPELDSWLGALTTESARNLAVRLALEHPELSSKDKLLKFWASVGRQVVNDERARLVEAEFDRLAGNEDRWVLGGWLVELTGARAAPRLEQLWQGEPAGRLAGEWLPVLGPEGRASVLAVLVRERPDQDTPGKRVELLQAILAKVPRDQQSRLVEANLKALEGRSSETGWPDAMLKLCAMKSDLTGPEGLPAYLAGHPETRPYADELEGWLTALPDPETRKIAMQAILSAPAGLSPEARQERILAFCRRATAKQADNEARARLVSWSLQDLLQRPADEIGDKVLYVHACWLHELRGEAAADEVLAVLDKLPAQKQRAERLRAWRGVVASPEARKTVTAALLADEVVPDPVTALGKLRLPGEDRARLVEACLPSASGPDDARTLSGWLFELRGEEALPRIETVLGAYPEHQATARALQEWPAETEVPALRRALAQAVLNGSQNVLYDALVAVRSDRDVTNEQRSALVEHRLQRATAPEEILTLCDYLLQLSAPRSAASGLKKLGTPAARAALGWGEAIGPDSPGLAPAYAAWLQQPGASTRERAAAMKSFLERARDIPSQDLHALLRYELGQLERLPQDGERDQAVGQVGAALIDSGEDAALPIVFKLLGKSVDDYQSLTSGVGDPVVLKILARTTLQHLDLRPDELGLQVLFAYGSDRAIPNQERIRVCVWILDRLLDPQLKLKQALPPARDFLAKLGDGLLAPAAEHFLRLASERFRATPSVQVSLAAQAGRIAAAPDHAEARRLLDEGLQSLERVQEIEDLLHPDQDIAIKEEDSAVIVGGVRVSKR